MPLEKPIEVELNLRSYRFVGEQAEALGLRLDAARKALAQSTKPWAKNHWTNVVNQLLFQWRNLPALHDSDATMLDVPRWNIDYSFYEIDDGIGYGFGERLMERFQEQANLQESWDRVREQRLARAQ